MLAARDARTSENGTRDLANGHQIRSFLHQIPHLGYHPTVMVTVVTVDPKTDLLTKVQELWRRHSDTLGFFPEGAFDEYARKRCVLAAVDEHGILLGYTLFRTTHQRKASIAHLCVAPTARGKGVARKLFEAVKPLVHDCDDITVRCRRDFSASALWPRLGFVAVAELRGRGKEAKDLTVWRYELNRLPLLAAMNQSRDDVMPVAIDANIFFDLDPEASFNTHDESKALAADWLGEFIELCVTEEMYNEINRREDPAHRARQRSRVEQFRVLPSDKVREEQVLTQLEKLFPTWTSDSDRSDMRQLTRAIAANITYFVTRDRRVREQAEDLYERFGLVVVSPFELVLEFDELRREQEYRPKRFISTDLKAMKPHGLEELERIADLLHVGQPFLRPRRQTLAQLREMVSAPDRFSITYIRGENSTLIAAYTVERPATDVLRLPLFAVADSALGRTAARHFTEKMTMLAASELRKVIEVPDDAGGQRIEDALRDAGFSREADRWIKFVLPSVASAEDLADEVNRIGLLHPETQALASRMINYLRPKGENESARGRTKTLIQVERALWPAKILGTELPCFIVPIKPSWAQHLFDVNLAERTLFGADPQLAMNSENAYYRAAKPAVVHAPGRVLWYVSHDSAYPGTMALRACSYLDDVLVAPPKEAYRRFRRLGVYTWRDVFEIAERDLVKNVMAFRFTKTELLHQPVKWARLQEVLQRHGKASQIQSPVKITESCFLELYKIGMGGA